MKKKNNYDDDYLDLDKDFIDMKKPGVNQMFLLLSLIILLIIYIIGVNLPRRRRQIIKNKPL